MIIDNNRIRNLLIGIVIVLILLTVCISVDYATNYTNNDTIVAVNNQTINMTNVTYLNDTHFALMKGSGVAKLNNVVVEKPKHNTITMTGKPSCSRCARNGCAYTRRTKTYVNYCPNCHHYNCLGNKHKWASRHEKEITCFRCDSDFCINCGKEKYSWSSVYLRK